MLALKGVENGSFNDTSVSRLKRKSAIIEREFEKGRMIWQLLFAIYRKASSIGCLWDDSLLSKEITTADISRPGLEMTGYFDYYTPERIQLVGMKEWSYLVKMSSHNRHQVLRKMFQPETPVIIVARNLEIPEEMLRAAEEKQLAILKSNVATSRLSGELSSYLDSRLAERTSVHGVLMDIYGMGVLIQGDSGIGKSETGLELVKRGHRLVADDRVDVFARDEMTLWGEPAEILRHLLEIRGVGIIDVMSLYGASAVKDSSQVQIAVYLETTPRNKPMIVLAIMQKKLSSVE